MREWKIFVHTFFCYKIILDSNHIRFPSFFISFIIIDNKVTTNVCSLGY